MLAAKLRPFVKYSENYNEHTLMRGRDEYGMTDADCKLVVQWLRSKAGENLSESRKRILISKICIIRKHLKKEFSEVTYNDLLDFCDAIRKEYTPHTCNETKSILKEFYRYLIRDGKTTITLDDLERIKKQNNIPSAVSPDDLLTADDITAMLKATPNPMHKALIAILAESGARIHEVAGLRWKDLTFDNAGCVLSLTSTKTNSRRYVRLRDSVPYLSMWKSLYQNYSPDEPVFVTERGTTLIYETCRATIKRIAEKAGIKKKITPHLFRHSRVTELLKLGMKEPELKKSLWGSVSTKMLAQYEHLAGQDVDNEYKRIFGIDTEADKPKPMLASVQCPGCHTINGDGAKFCMTCGRPLTKEAEQQVKTIEQMVTEMYLKFQEEKRQVGQT